MIGNRFPISIGMLPLVALSVACFLVIGIPPSTHAYIDVFRPETLGAVCERAQSITVFKVTKFSKEKRLILFHKVKDLKGKYPRDGLREHLGSAHLPHEVEHYLKWLKDGNTVVVFRYENRQAICIGEQWTVCDSTPPKDPKEPWTITTRTEPWFLQTYCGDAEKLPDLAADILDRKEVVVPCMIGRRDKELRDRKGERVSLKVSLKRKDYNLKRDRVDR